MIRDFSALSCYDPRDRVFALLSLVQVADDRIPVDYHTPASEVFWRVFAKWSGSRKESELNRGTLFFLKKAMGVTGQEKECRGLALASWKCIFPGSATKNWSMGG